MKKDKKYQPLVDVLKSKFQRVTIDVMVVGGTGTWDPRNDRLMLKLRSKKYLALLKRLVVSATLAWSRKIYIHHLDDKVQYGDRDIPKIRTIKPGGNRSGVEVEELDVVSGFTATSEYSCWKGH